MEYCLSLAELLIIRFPKQDTYKVSNHLSSEQTESLAHSISFSIRASAQSVELQLCFQSAYHGRCWGMWGKLSQCPQAYPLWCPPGRPSAVSRPPLLLFWGSHSDWRGMETLHIYILHINNHGIWKMGFLQYLHRCIHITAGQVLTWRRRRLARRSLPRCSLIVNKQKPLKQKKGVLINLTLWGRT